MRATNRLTVAYLRTAPVGKHCDGAGLWLIKRDGGGAQWVLRVTVHGRRRHPTKWLGYLHALDAREAGATWQEISALYPQTNQTEQTARDTWEAARALCFNF